MPGVGKSYWLKKLKNYYGCGGTDLDLFIEIKHQARISELFEHGEGSFRQKEASALRTLISSKENEQLHLISTGGGTPCFYENMPLMLQTGITVYLEAQPSFIKSRLEQAKIARPLIEKVAEENRLEFITELLEERAPFYKQSQLTVNAIQVDLSTFATNLEKFKIYP